MPGPGLTPFGGGGSAGAPGMPEVTPNQGSDPKGCKDCKMGMAVNSAVLSSCGERGLIQISGYVMQTNNSKNNIFQRLSDWESCPGCNGYVIGIVDLADNEVIYTLIGPPAGPDGYISVNLGAQKNATFKFFFGSLNGNPSLELNKEQPCPGGSCIPSYWDGPLELISDGPSAINLVFQPDLSSISSAQCAD